MGGFTGRSRRVAGLLLLGAALATPGCGAGGADGTAEGRGAVLGQLVMASGDPVARARVSFAGVSGAWETRTDGTFEALVPPGEHLLLAALSGVELAQRRVTMIDFATVQLGEIVVDESADGDDDGLADAIEVVGWDILVNENGRRVLTTRHVTSDPSKADTDGDGLEDAEELASLTDPRRRDTDGDKLTDPDEIRVYKSNPADVDTDLDASGPTGLLIPNPSLFDGNEYLLSKTSPVLADTDGDGLTDFEEITGGGLAPLVADLPQIAIELNGDPNIKLNVVSKQSQQASTETFTLAQDTSTRTKVDAQSMKDTFSNETQITASAKVGGPPLSGNASLEATNTTKNVFTLDWSTSTTDESVAQNQSRYQTTLTNNTVSETSSGDFAAAFKVRNVGKRGVRIEDLSVAAYRLTPRSASGFTVIDILGPAPTQQGQTEVQFPSVVLGPDGEFTFLAKSRALNLDQIEPLLRNPSSLFFEVANYSIFQTDDTGAPVRDYAAIGERVLERCGLLTIDFGNGETDTFTVATNVRRNPDGSAAGLPLTEALATLGFPYTTQLYKVGATTTDIPVLHTVTDRRGRKVGLIGTETNDFATPSKVVPKVGFWTLMATGRALEPVYRPDVGNGTTPLPRPLSEVVLRNGERISLVFLTDTDGDGLFDNEELLLGTDARKPDTDGDGVTDGYEVKHRRLVSFVGVNYDGRYDYTVTSDPLRADADGDHLSDLQEIALGTDPNKADSDDDLQADDVDPSPLDAPASGVSDAGLKVWYPLDRNANPLRSVRDDSTQTLAKRLSGSTFPDTQDILTTGLTEGSNVYTDRFGILGRAVYLLQESNSPAAYYTAPDPQLGPNGELTIAVWVRPGGGGSGGVCQFSDSTGFSYDGSNLDFELFVQGNTGSPATTATFSVPTNAWTFAVATISRPTVPGSSEYTLRLFKNGVLADTKSVFSLPTRAGTLVVGAGRTEADFNESFTGALDDVRVYDRPLSVSEIEALYRERNYDPQN